MFLLHGSSLSSMESPYGFRRNVKRFFKNHDVNMLITAILGLAATYIAFATILSKNIFHPFEKSPPYMLEDDPAATAMTIVILWVFSSASGKILNLLNFPFPFGAMLVGVIIGNVPVLSFFEINHMWDLMVRRLALVVLIIRWGLAFNISFIIKHWKTVLLFGTIPASMELGAIAVTAAVAFHHHVGISIMLGSVMAAASVPIIIPIMFDLQRRGLGLERDLPRVIPSSLAVGTFICLTIFTVAGSCVYTKVHIINKLLSLFCDVGVCAVGGITLGVTLWHFPKAKEGHALFARGYILFFASVGAINGMFFFGHGYAGIVFVLLLGTVCGYRWRTDNPRTITSIEKAFLYIWNLVASPLLFVLVGMKLKFALMSASTIFSIVALITVGLIFRVTGAFMVASCRKFELKEKLVVMLSMAPKATLQGALAPSVLTLASQLGALQEEAEFIVNASLLSVFLTAPTFRLLLAYVAPVLLKKPVEKQMVPSPSSNTSLQIVEASEEDAPTEVKVMGELAIGQGLTPVSEQQK